MASSTFFGLLPPSLLPGDELDAFTLNTLIEEMYNHPDYASYIVDQGRLFFRNDNENFGSYLRGVPCFVFEKKFEAGSCEHKEKPKRIVITGVMKDAPKLKAEDKVSDPDPNLYSIEDFLRVKSKASECKTIMPAIDKYILDSESEETIEINVAEEDYRLTEEFVAAEKARGSLVLIPMKQNQRVSITGTEKKHIVLVAIDFATMQLNMINSQIHIPIIGNWIYTDRLPELKQDLQYRGPEDLGIQWTSHTCGYYVHNMLLHFLDYGNKELLCTIKIDPKIIRSREYYCKNWREITLKMNPRLADEEPIMIPSLPLSF
jgi:hypothetical protein